MISSLILIPCRFKLARMEVSVGLAVLFGVFGIIALGVISLSFLLVSVGLFYLALKVAKLVESMSDKVKKPRSG